MSRRLLIGFAVLTIIGGLVYLVWGGLEKNMVYFVTPSELLGKGRGAIGQSVRLGGVVVSGSLETKDGLITFNLSDDHRTIPVITTKAPPQMFQEGIGAVVEGALRPDGRFEAARLMVKHGNEYRPPKEGEMPQEIYKELRRSN